MKISIIIPIFNSEKYIEKCLESVLQQTYTDFEIICIDDGSTDNTWNILKKFKNLDKRIVAFQTLNKGRSSARNFGMKVASGEYLAFLDSDDELEENALEILTENIASEPDAVVSSIDVLYEVHAQKSIQDKNYYTVNLKGVYHPSPDLLMNFHCSVCGCLFKKETIINNDIFFPEGLNYEDAYFHWTFFPVACKICFVPRYTYRYIRRPGSIMSLTFERNPIALQHLDIMRKIIEFHIKNSLFKEYESVILKTLSNYFWLSFNYSPDGYKCLAITKCQAIIREFELRTGAEKTLEDVRSEKIGYMFADSNRPDFLLASKMVDVFEALIPQNSIRRKCLYPFLKKFYLSLRKKE